MSSVDIATGVRVSCNVGTLKANGSWVEYHVDGESRSNYAGIRLFDDSVEHVRRRMEDLRAIVSQKKNAPEGLEFTVTGL